MAWRMRLGDGQSVDGPKSLVAAVAQGYRLITNASAAAAGPFSVCFEALERVSDAPRAGTHQYAPLIFTHREKVTGHDKLHSWPSRPSLNSARHDGLHSFTHAGPCLKITAD